MMHSPPAEMPGPEDELSLRDYWYVLWRQRRFIGTVFGLLVVVVTVWTLWQPNIYRSTATLLPLSGSRSSLATALGELGGLAPGLSSTFSKENPTDRLLAILQSYTLALEVVRYLDLRPLLFETQWNANTQQWRTPNAPTEQEAVRRLQTLVSITASRQGVTTIAVEHPDPVLSAAIANQYISALQQSLRENAFSLAKKNRLFIAAQMAKTHQDLAMAEEALKKFEQIYGIVALDAQTTAAVEAIAHLEEQIRTKEVQLRVQQRVTTGASQEVTLLQEGLRGLREQLARLQRGLPSEQPAMMAQATTDLAWIPLQEAPDIKLRYARLQRESLVQTKIYTLLAQQLEQAKIDESRDEIAFQVLDRALPPDRRSKPKRAQSILLMSVVGLFVGVALAFVRNALDSTVHSAEQVEHLLGLPVLATIPGPLAFPLPGHGREGVSPHDGMKPSPGTSSVTLPLQYLYTRLKYLDSERSVQTVLMVGPGIAEATSALLTHFALAVACTSNKILLLDANLQQPTLHQIFHCALTPGLAETLTAPEQWQHSIQPTQVENMHLVAAGASTSSTLASLASADFDRLLQRYKEVYDLILCAAPSTPGLHEAIVLGKKTDTTCFVLQRGVSSRAAVLASKRALEAIQAHVAGAVFLDAALLACSTSFQGTRTS